MECPNDTCRCEDWPPEGCPQCDVTILGATGEDWWRHFREECNPLGSLYCFATEPDGEVRAA